MNVYNQLQHFQCRKIIENRLAACVNITKNVESIYEWDGKVITDKESLLIIKSNSSKTKDLIEFVERNHSYDCPEVITIRVSTCLHHFFAYIHVYLRLTCTFHDTRSMMEARNTWSG